MLRCGNRLRASCTPTRICDPNFRFQLEPFMNAKPTGTQLGVLGGPSVGLHRSCMFHDLQRDQSWPVMSEQLRLIDKWTPAGFALSV
jgi:hypothetical protein